MVNFGTCGAFADVVQKVSISRSCRISIQLMQRCILTPSGNCSLTLKSTKCRDFFLKFDDLFKNKCNDSSNGQCVLWPRKPQKHGYGTVKYKCPMSGQWRCITAHRLAFMVLNRQMDLRDKDISHLCHNCLCVCNEHLSAIR